MRQPIGDDGFALNPQNIAPDAWYYEDTGGLQVYHSGNLICVIPWRKVEASLRRKQARKRRRTAGGEATEWMKQILDLHEVPHPIRECNCGQCYQARQALRVANEEIERRKAGGEARA